MAQSPRTSSSLAEVTILVASVTFAATVVWALYVVVFSPDKHQPVFCPTPVPIQASSTVASVIQESAARANARPQNMDVAVNSAPKDALRHKTASVCFDSSKHHVASINGKLVPKG